MASIQRIVSPLTGEISYRAQIRVKGRRSMSETFTNRKAAAKWAARIETGIDEGKHFPHLKAAKTPFADLVARYQESVLKDAKRQLQISQGRHLAWWAARFAGLSLAEITVDKVVEARDALSAERFTRGKARPDPKTGELIAPNEYARAAATVNKYVKTLARVFALAVREWRLIDRNPAADVSKKKEPRGRTRFLSDEERAKLLEACAASDWKPLYALVLLALSTGARRGELLRLTWADVSLDPKAPRALIRESKNGDERVLPLVGKALEALRELKLQGSAISQFVFRAPNGRDEPYTYFDGTWYPAVEAAGLKDFRFHDLRHSCASYLAAQGASLLEIADTLGHRTLAMVRRYAHLAQSHKTAAIERMAKAKDL
jgi:integrase